MNSGRWRQVGAWGSQLQIWLLCTHHPLSPLLQATLLPAPPHTYPSSLKASPQPAIPSQDDYPPKIRNFIFTQQTSFNSTQPIIFRHSTSRADKSKLQEKKGFSQRPSAVGWRGKLVSSNHEAKDVLIHLHL